MLTSNELDEIRARCEAATPGMWERDLANNVWDNRHVMFVAEMRGWGHLTGKCALALSDEEATAIQNANAEFIAHARQDVPALLEAYEKLVSEYPFGSCRLNYDQPCTVCDRCEAWKHLKEERDRWEKWTVALENALNVIAKHGGLPNCVFCKTDRSACPHFDPEIAVAPCRFFEFDEARFARKGE